jgi:Kdo2-lipid IVA lauroyltransferase/acyltransferase
MKLSVISYMKKKSDILSALVFYLAYSIIWTITLLPLRVLFVLSDFLFLVLYYFPSYRRKVVAQNLRNSFPEKTEKELHVIGKKFYRHLADLFIEILKLTHLSEAEHRRRVTFSNLQVLDNLLVQKRDVAAVLGHYNNWEWLSILSKCTGYKLSPIYKPLQNKYFDNFLTSLRNKYNTNPVAMSNIIREIISDRKENINAISAFVSDQTPAITSIRYWTDFLNQETPVYTGIEKIASKYDMALVYFDITKIKRGYYNMNVELMFEHTAGLPEHLITETHVKRLEKTIRDKPEYWIWSHRRWKHKKPADNA